MRIWLLMLIGGFFLFLFTGCERDFDIAQNSKRKLTVNCLLDNERPIRVFLTNGDALGQSSSKITVDNAQVSIYKNDSFLTQLNYSPYDSIKSFGAYTNNIYPSVGNLYSIHVNHPSFGEVYAEEYLDESPLVSNFSLYEFKNPSKHQKSAFQLLFKDDYAKENYYLVAAMCVGKERKRVNSNTFIYADFETPAAPYLLSDLPDTVRESGYYLLFSDRTFNGQSKPIDFWFYDNVDTSSVLSDTFVVELQTISYSHYQYIKSLEAYRNTSKSTYPDIVFSNIRNGMGIFMTAGIERLKIPIK